jgi:hypothetical protein
LAIGMVFFEWVIEVGAVVSFTHKVFIIEYIYPEFSVIIFGIFEINKVYFFKDFRKVK